MSILVALAHIGGAVIVSIVLGFGLFLVAEWDRKRVEKLTIADMSLALGVPPTALDVPENAQKVLSFASQKFSDDLLKNRLSDFCGVVLTIWGWLSNLLQVGILLGVSWYAFTDDPADAVYAWMIIPVIVFFWVTSVMFSLACRLLTGRYPGQAKLVRRSLAQFVETQSHN